MIEENRWRARRYGIDGKLIDFGRKREVETRSLLHEMLEFVAPEVDEFGSQREMAHIERIIREGTVRTGNWPFGNATMRSKRW